MGEIAVIAVAVGTFLVIAALCVALTIFTRRAGYSWGPLWQSPVKGIRQAGPVRRAGAAIGAVGFIAYLVAIWRGPSYLPNIVLGVDFVLLGFVNILEPVMPNTRLNLRWLGAAFVLIGLGQLILGVARLASGRPAILLLLVLVPLFLGVIVSFILAYVRAFPPPRR